MTKREFFIVMLRLFALYIICVDLLGIFVTIPLGGLHVEALKQFTVGIFAIALLVLVIINAAKIVDAFKMTSGLNEEFSGPSISGRNLVQIGIIILGLNMSLTMIVDLLLGILDLFREEVNNDYEYGLEPLSPNATVYLPIILIKVAFGLLLVWKSGWLTSLIMKKSEI